jgi:hypothetical protein
VTADTKSKTKVEADFTSTQKKIKKTEKNLAEVDEAIDDVNNLGTQGGQVDLDADQLAEYQQLRQKSMGKTSTLRTQVHMFVLLLLRLAHTIFCRL